MTLRAFHFGLEYNLGVGRFELDEDEVVHAQSPAAKGLECNCWQWQHRAAFFFSCSSPSSSFVFASSSSSCAAWSN